ncbi:Tubulin_tyrosine ligase-like 5 [Hexamita inflata]|uniref:Tubulin--tyrosine ligase-like protein 5 n=1 Tax=Hexamita inflata TaxID=28002 RepID=A0AA86U613_9EUKA|nr:Tubulin tyrosine ligase-like 5 [Hexamita inflata]
MNLAYPFPFKFQKLDPNKAVFDIMTINQTETEKHFKKNYKYEPNKPPKTPQIQKSDKQKRLEQFIKQEAKRAKSCAIERNCNKSVVSLPQVNLQISCIQQINNLHNQLSNQQCSEQKLRDFNEAYVVKDQDVTQNPTIVESQTSNNINNTITQNQSTQNELQCNFVQNTQQKQQTALQILQDPKLSMNIQNQVIQDQINNNINIIQKSSFLNKEHDTLELIQMSSISMDNQYTQCFDKQNDNNNEQVNLNKSISLNIEANNLEIPNLEENILALSTKEDTLLSQLLLDENDLNTVQLESEYPVPVQYAEKKFIRRKIIVNNLNNMIEDLQQSKGLIEQKQQELQMQLSKRDQVITAKRNNINQLRFQQYLQINDNIQSNQDDNIVENLEASIKQVKLELSSNLKEQLQQQQNQELKTKQELEQSVNKQETAIDFTQTDLKIEDMNLTAVQLEKPAIPEKPHFKRYHLFKPIKEQTKNTPTWLKQNFKIHCIVPQCIVGTFYSACGDICEQITVDTDTDYYNNDNSADIIWQYKQNVNLSVIRLLNEYQWINHFTGIECIANKLQLYRHSLQVSSKLFPLTFSLPSQFTQLCTHYAQTRDMFIVKPSNLSRGREISLARDPLQILYERQSIAQVYVQNPLTIFSRKCDFRCYMLVLNAPELKFFLYYEGICRISPNIFDIQDTRIETHITNTSVSKLYDQDSRMLLSDSLKHLQVNNFTTKILSCAKLLFKLLTQTKSSTDQQPFENNRKCFELIGFDVLFNSNCEAFIIEANASPSLQCDCDLDWKLKPKLLRDIFAVLSGNVNEEFWIEG